jgi:hypothetical protein
MGQAGQARRHHPADRHRQIEAGHRKLTLVLIDVMVRNQNEEKVATGEAMVEFPHG